MPLRFRPTDTSFYDMFSESAKNLVAGAELLAEMLPNGADRADIATRMREAEHQGDEITHAHRRARSTPPSSRRSTARTSTGSRPALDDVMDFMEEAVDLVLLYEIERAARASWPTRSRCSSAPPSSPPTRCRGCGRCTTSRSTGSRSTGWRTTATSPTAGSVAKLFNGQYDALTVMKLKDVVDSLEAAIDAFETWPTSSSRSRSRSPDGWSSRSSSPSWSSRSGFDYTNGFHDAANAIATSISTRALTPRVALTMAAVMNFAGALLGQEVANTVSEVITPPAGDEGLVVILAALARRDHLEPDDLVLRPAVLVLARADRRPGRRGPGLGQRRRLDRDRRQGPDPDGALAARRLRASRSC